MKKNSNSQIISHAEFISASNSQTHVEKIQRRGKSCCPFPRPFSLRRAFTLAEVLIVIGIIGVIAQATIPTLVNNYQKEMTVTQLKKAYSEISQAVTLAEAQSGTSDTWDWYGFSLAGTQYFADNYFYPFIKTIKKCPNGNTECWKSPVSLSNMSGYMNAATDPTSLSVITASGYSIYFWTGGAPYYNHVRIYIDVDGPNKGRGKLGRDVFGIVVILKGDTSIKKGVYPSGVEAIPPISRDQMINDSSQGCSKSVPTITAGFYCAGLIASDGWKISDDYPWN